MKTSENGLNLIKSFEGLRPEAYQDIAGIWTIGYGHTASAKPGMKVTKEEAEGLLRRDLEIPEAAIRRRVKVAINQNQFDSLASFVFNVGVGGFMRSTVLKRLNAGNYNMAADALLWWAKYTDPKTGILLDSPGLLRRRRAERAWFLSPVP